MLEVWVPAMGTFAVQIVVAVYVYGKLSQANAEHARRLDKLENEQGEQWDCIHNTSQQVAEIRGKIVARRPV